MTKTVTISAFGCLIEISEANGIIIASDKDRLQIKDGLLLLPELGKGETCLHSTGPQMRVSK